jgi:hypothetical protein
MPAHPVDATLSNQLIHKCVTEESICLADVAKPSQGKVAADLTLSGLLALVLNECGSELSVASIHCDHPTSRELRQMSSLSLAEARLSGLMMDIIDRRRVDNP